ncbi:hypothetical protein [Brevibacillus laterosporus]|uniref:hypothetical protein n=1 Tax=Brevibacillus laterosporus TaxID=1465 RepID=UPI00265CB968|nr:hypothetical protein [Brevibacillus laterosporus]
MKSSDEEGFDSVFHIVIQSPIVKTIIERTDIQGDITVINVSLQEQRLQRSGHKLTPEQLLI